MSVENPICQLVAYSNQHSSTLEFNASFVEISGSQNNYKGNLCEVGFLCTP